jgi:iron complex outermembrane recepter protein
MNNKRILIGLPIIAFMAAYSPAMAQDITASAEQNDTPSTDSNVGIAEIIVTAQRRTESVQKSSLSIQVVGSEELQQSGVASVRDLAAVAPGVQITQAGAYTQTYIRGVGDYTANNFAQTAISYTIDGVNIDRASAISPNFYDLARVEVLKGPQGTLYGRNATGGAVNLVTNQPTQELEGYVTGEYGNFDALKVAGALNVPLAETLAVRFAGQIIERDGYLSDGTDDNRQQAARVQVLWEPGTDVTLRLSADYGNQGGKGAGSVAWPTQPGTGPWTADSDPVNVAYRTALTDLIFFPGVATPLGTDSFLDNKLWNVSAELNAQLGDFATLTVLPAYRHQRLRQRTYTIGSLNDTPSDLSDQYSIEVRLGNQTPELKWVLGGYYFRLDNAATFLVNATPFIPGFYVRAAFPSYRTTSYAAFGEATYSISDTFRVIGGLRYTQEEKSLNGNYTDLSTSAAFDYVLDDTRTDDAVTWKAGFEYDASPSSMIYATASRGFKSGGFFMAPSGDNSFNPEELTAFSIGSRNRFLDNTLQVNVEAFYWQYRDQQASSVGFTNSGLVTFVTRNVGAANPYGVDLDVLYKPTANDTLNFSVNYIHAEFSQFVIPYPAFLAANLATGCQKAAAGPLVNVDCSGFDMARTPKWTGRAAYEHIFDLPGGGTLTPNVNMTFASSRYLSIDFFTPETRTGGYALFNAGLAYDAPDSAFSINAFVRNIGNTAVYLGSQSDVLVGNLINHRTIGAPRTYGVSATVRF